MARNTPAAPAAAAPAVPATIPPLPPHLAALAARNMTKSAASVGSGESVPRISLKGKRFRYLIDGQEAFVDKDESKIIVLDVRPEGQLSAKTWYAKGYNPNAADPPDCSSTNGINPDGWVQNPQATLCAKCPQNVWGSATSMAGKRAKSCKDSKVLSVVNEEDKDNTVFKLGITVASFKSFGEYARMLETNGVPINAIVTKLNFVEDSDFPQLEFTMGEYLSEQMYEELAPIMDETVKKNGEKANALPPPPPAAGPAMLPGQQLMPAAPPVPGAGSTATTGGILNAWGKPPGT